MPKLEGWGFVLLMTGLLAVILSLTLLHGPAAVGMSLAGVVLCVLSGGVYAASAKPGAAQKLREEIGRQAPGD